MTAKSTDDEIKELRAKVAELAVTYVETQKIIFMQLLAKGIIDRDLLSQHLHKRRNEDTKIMSGLYETLAQELGL